MVFGDFIYSKIIRKYKAEAEKNASYDITYPMHSGKKTGNYHKNGKYGKNCY